MLFFITGTDNMSLIGITLGFFLEHPIVIVVLLLPCVFVFVLSRVFSGPEPGPNPFEENVAREAKPLVTDQAARDKVIKQGKYHFNLV